MHPLENVDLDVPDRELRRGGRRATGGLRARNNRAAGAGAAGETAPTAARSPADRDGWHGGAELFDDVREQAATRAEP